MRGLSIVLLVCFSVGTIAQEKEAWACQQERGTGLFWENGAWERYNLSASPLLLSIAESNSSFKTSDLEIPLHCSIVIISDTLTDSIFHFSTTHCADSTHTLNFILDPETGKLGKSALYGAINSGDNKDSVSAEVLNCTKF